MAKLRTLQPIKVFEPANITTWVSQLISGLHYAHTTARIVHRDLKPSNLIINKTGDLKIMDFGIARSIADSMFRTTMRETSTGTLPYMSPQQALGKPVSISDDIYSFGCTLYELLTGKPPFFTGNVMEQVRTVKPTSVAERRLEFGVTGQPIPENWESVLQSCLAKEPAARPRDMQEIGRLLGLEAAFGTDTSRRPVAREEASVSTAAVQVLTADVLEGNAVSDSAPISTGAVTPPLDTPTSGALGQSLTQAHTSSAQTGQTNATLSPRTSSIAAPLPSRKLGGTGAAASTTPASASVPATRKGRPTPGAPRAAAAPRPIRAAGDKKKGSPFLGIAIVLGVLLLMLGLGAGGLFVVYKKVIEPKIKEAQAGLKDPQANPDALRMQIELASNTNPDEAKALLATYKETVGNDAFAESMTQKLGLAVVTSPETPKTNPPETPKTPETPNDQTPKTPETPKTNTTPVVESGERQPLLVPEKFKSIQAAINAAKPGDVISIKPDYYEEMLTLRSGLTLQPQSDQPVVVSAPGRNGSVMTADGVKGTTVRGMIFQHSGTEDSEQVRWAVVAIKNSTIVLENCQIRSGMGSGLAVSGGGGSIIRKCIIEKNAWYGVMLERGADATLESCTSQQNGGPGIFIAHIGTKPTLRGNTIMRNLHSGIVIEEDGQAVLEGNVSELNLEMGAALSGANVSAVMKGNKFSSNKMDGLSVQDGAKVTLVSNEIKSNQRNGIVIYDAADGSEISDNQIVGNTLDGLVMAISPNGTGTYANTLVKGNTASGQSISGIRLIGAGVTPRIEGNKIFSNGQRDILPTDGAAPVLKDNQLGGAPTPPATTQQTPPKQTAPTQAPPATQTPPSNNQSPLKAKNNGGSVPVMDPDAGMSDDSAMRPVQPTAPTTPDPSRPQAPAAYQPPPTPPAADPSATPQAPPAAQQPAQQALPSKNQGNIPTLDPDAGGGY